MIIAPFRGNVNRFAVKKSDYFDLDRQMLLKSPFFVGFSLRVGGGRLGASVCEVPTSLFGDGSIFCGIGLNRNKRLTPFRSYYISCRTGSERIGRDPLRTLPDPRFFPPQDSPRRRRVPVK